MKALAVSTGSIYQFCKTLSKNAELSIAHLEEELLNQRVVATDATPVTNNGKMCYIQNFSITATVPAKALTILSFLPSIHNKRTNIQYITSDEVTRLRVCADEGSIPRRDKAILFLLLYTGIRACDIAGIMFDSIDWENERFHFIQQKTRNSPELPLIPLVGNAIFDYIMNYKTNS